MATKKSKKPSDPAAGKGSSDAVDCTKQKCNKKRVIVIDPGHGGPNKPAKVGGSSWNNATAASKVLEKTLTLQYGKSLKTHLLGAAAQKIFKSRGFSSVEVVLTRTTDVNVSLAGRRDVAKKKKADIFASIHFNGFNKKVRGTETFYLSKGSGQTNMAEDAALAKKVNDSLVRSLKALDKGASNRKHKGARYGVLRDPGKGLSGKMCRSVLMEIEFIDNKAADKLLVSGKSAGANREKIMADLALALAKAL